ncbi:MAG: tRNA lysidine(34) synthetase TilS [Dehalococcoidales bacterium]|nr:tRNA lysidine(34) synthetase TilS [Dehalococcoidales bacterium]
MVDAKLPDAAGKVLNFIRDNHLVAPGQKILVAVSGGPDSVCLLHLLYSLQNELGISLQIAHLNHRLRGAESEADARYVSSLAEKLKIPCTVTEADVREYRQQHRLSLEEAAREVRYAFLARVAREAGAGRVATGHTLNDHLETILLHFIRGTGIQGLRGLRACQTLEFSGERLTVIRPLLGFRREETEEYCRIHSLSPRQDISNFSLSLLRNRVRHELLPLLQKYNEGIYDVLSRIGQIMDDEIAFLDSQVDRVWSQIASQEDMVLILVKDGLKNLPRALQRHLLRRALASQLGTLKDIEMRHIEEMLQALMLPPGRKISLPRGLYFEVEYQRYLLGRQIERLIPFPEIHGIYRLNIPGKTVLPGWEIEAEILPADQIPVTGIRDEFTACFDFAITGADLILRTRKKGDRFQPLGMSQIKKVGEFMLDARIPRSWRDRIPVICSPRQIIWLAGCRIDERVKVTPQTREVLCLRMKRIAEIV